MSDSFIQRVRANRIALRSFLARHDDEHAPPTLPEAWEAVYILRNEPFGAGFSLNALDSSPNWQARFSLWSKARKDHLHISRRGTTPGEAIYLAARDAYAAVKDGYDWLDERE